MVESVERRFQLKLDSVYGYVHLVPADPQKPLEQLLRKQSVIAVATTEGRAYRHSPDNQIVDATGIPQLKLHFPTDVEEGQKAIIIRRRRNPDVMPLVYLLGPKDKVIDPTDGSQVYP